MKLSSNSIGALIFTALAIAVFVFMAMRPVVEGNAVNFGMPVKAESEAGANSATTMPANEVKTEELTEPVKVEGMESQAPQPEAPSVNAPVTESIPAGTSTTEMPATEAVTEPVPVESTVPTLPTN